MKFPVLEVMSREIPEAFPEAYMSSMNDMGRVTCRRVPTECIGYYISLALNLIKGIWERHHGLDPAGLVVIKRGIVSCLAQF